jgi:hypothetical protein
MSTPYFHTSRVHTLPRQVPSVAHLDYYGERRASLVGRGDLCDFIPVEGGALALCIGEPAFTLHYLDVFLTARIADLRGAAAESIAEANRFVCDVAPDNFSATLFCGRIDTVRGELRYASARHETALLVRKGSGRMRRLESTGAVLGLSGRVNWSERRIPLDPGDLVAVYTGDAREDEVMRVIRESPDVRARTLVTSLLVDAGCRTAMAVRFLGDQPCVLEEECAALAVA